jgi:hypothetical protein
MELGTTRVHQIHYAVTGQRMFGNLSSCLRAVGARAITGALCLSRELGIGVLGYMYADSGL